MPVDPPREFAKSRLLDQVRKRSLWSRSERRQIRFAYLGYAVCAVVLGLFQFHLHVDGPEISMMFGVFLFPFAIAACVAIANTVGARSATLRVLGGATVVVVLFAILPGAVLLTNAIAHAYEIFVLIACVYRRREWWPQSEAT